MAENVWEKSMPERGRCLSTGYAALSGPVAVEEERFVAPARNSAVRRGNRKRNETPHGTWLDGAWKGGIWFCYARSLA